MTRIPINPLPVWGVRPCHLLLAALTTLYAQAWVPVLSDTRQHCSIRARDKVSVSDDMQGESSGNSGNSSGSSINGGGSVTEVTTVTGLWG